MKVKISKPLLKEELYQQYLDLRLSCIRLSFEKEKQLNSYVSKLQILNNETGEIKGASSYVKNQTKHNQALSQKASALISIANQRSLTAVFLTFTNPSKYHYFNSYKKNDVLTFTRVNKNFGFESVEDAIAAGYKNLNKIFRNFYKRVKEVSKNIYYIGAFEPHKSMQVHFHMILFIEKEYLEAVEDVFKNQVEYYKLTRTDFKVLNDAKNETSLVGAYVKKYLFKTLENSNDNSEVKQSKASYARFLDGWKKHFKIKTIKMSNLPLSLEVYKKIYHSLDREYLQPLIKELSLKNKSLFQYFMENVNISKIIYDANSDTYTYKTPLVNFTSEFDIEIYVEKKSIYDPYNEVIKTFSKTIQFSIIHNHNGVDTQIYNKQNYQVLQLHYTKENLCKAA